MTQRRSDIFKKKKGVHVQLDKDTHAHFRKELFTVGLSMQEAFEHFAQLVAVGDHRAKRLLESYVNGKIRQEIEGMKVPPRRELSNFGELDSEKLYSLINETDDLVEEEDGADGDQRKA